MKILILLCFCITLLNSQSLKRPTIKSNALNLNNGYNERCIFDLVRLVTKLEKLIDDLESFQLNPNRMVKKVLSLLPIIQVSINNCNIAQNQTLFFYTTCNNTLHSFIKTTKEIINPFNKLKVKCQKISEIKNYIQAVNISCQTKTQEFKKFKTDWSNNLVSFAKVDNQEEAVLDEAATTWILISTALVILMAPGGLTLFYGGLTQRKNVLNTIGMSYVAFLIGMILWQVIGYSLAFSGDFPVIGDLNDVFLIQSDINDLDHTVPKRLHTLFQGAFASVSIALVGGSVVERINFRAWLLFSTLWSVLVYPIITRWVWSEYGFLYTLGHIDFAGGTVVHVNSGVSALVICLIVGKRLEEKSNEYKPSSIKMMILGTAILWFGWLGFNGGNGRDSNGNWGDGFSSTNAVLITNVGAIVGGITWMLIEWWFSKEKKPTLIGIGSGIMSGLVGSTSLAGYVDFQWSLLISLISGIVGYWGVIVLKRKINRYDDTLDVFGIHGLVGIWGALATGIFSNPDINPEGVGGVLYGDWMQLVYQTIGTLVTIVYSGGMSAILFYISAAIMGGYRVEVEEEKKGLDKAFHKEDAFDFTNQLGNKIQLCIVCQENEVGK